MQEEQLFRYRYNGRNYKNMKDLCLSEGISKRKFSVLVKMGYIKKLDNKLNVVSHGSKKV